MHDIVVTEFMDAEPLADLKAHYSIHRDDTLWEKPEELGGLLGSAKAIIVRNKTQVTDTLLDSAPELKVVGRLGVGLDNIDLPSCQRRGVEVCPATGANADAVAEYVVTSALVLLRGAYRHTNTMLAGHWPRPELSDGREISGTTFGLIGFGNIGQMTARRAAALGMTVVAHDPALPAEDPAWSGVERLDFSDVVARSDVVSLHVPLVPDTRHLMSADVIATMRPEAVLINTARGGVVDETALTDALRRGHLHGAALDVFEQEPPDAECLARFKGLNNVILTPHIAGLSADANVRVSRLTVDNVLKVLTSA